MTGPRKAGETLWAVVRQDKGHYFLFGNRSKSNIGAPMKQNGKIVDQSFKTL